MWAALSRWQRVRLIWGILFTGLLAPHTKELAELIEGMKVCSLILFRREACTRPTRAWQTLQYMSSLQSAAAQAPALALLTIKFLSWQESDAMTEALIALGEEYPALLRPLIEERDEFMICMLRQVCHTTTPPVLFSFS